MTHPPAEAKSPHSDDEELPGALAAAAGGGAILLMDTAPGGGGRIPLVFFTLAPDRVVDSLPSFF